MKITKIKKFFQIIFCQFLPFFLWGNVPQEELVWAIQEEFLYLQPIFDNTFIQNPNVVGPFPFSLGQPGSRKKNKFDYERGYRFSAFYNFQPNCWIDGISLRYTYLPAYHKRKIGKDSSLFSQSSYSFDPILIADQDFHSLLAEHNLNYYAGDFFVTRTIIDQNCFKLKVEPGLHYAWMNYFDRVSFSARSPAPFLKATLKENSDTWGVGPQIGFILDYDLFSWLSFEGVVNGGLLVASSKVNFKTTAKKTTAPLFHPIKAHNRQLWRVLPFWEGRLSTNFLMSLYCYQMELEIGYEYLSYPDFISRIRSKKNRFPTLVNDLYSNVSYQGPFISLLVGF